MRQRIQFVACLLLCLPVATALAASPHFNGAGDAMTSAPVAPATTDKPTAAPTDPAKVEPAASGKEATAVTDTTAAKPPVSDKSAETGKTAPAAPVKKSGSWLSRLFRKREAAAPETFTEKKDGDLVNTEKRHKQIYDLLESADIHHFEPGPDIRWQVKSSNVMCRMSQQVPHYGFVEFRQGVAQPLEFAMYVDQIPGGSGVVQVSSEPARWQHFVKAKKLGVLELDTGDTAVTASAEWSRRLFMELEQGMQPVLRFWDAADASEDVEVYLSALEFRDSLDKFQTCLAQLLKYDFNQVKANVLHFNPDSSKMRKQTYAQLDEVLETAKVDKGVTEVNLEIYTSRDGLERYNFRLATRRAQAVRDYLIKHGIKEDIIFIKIHTQTKAQLAKLGYKDSDVYISLRRDKKKIATATKPH
jgi:outer membrane protein OmpA-like peptidoglycan-associated protein